MLFLPNSEILPTLDNIKFKTLEIHFGTNRNYKNNDFGTDIVQKLSLGKMRISIPIKNEGFTPTDTEVIDSLQVLSKSDFMDSLKHDQGKNAFVFIHGYNTSFKDAALRCAQIVYDTNFNGFSSFFSWASNVLFSNRFSLNFDRLSLQTILKIYTELWLVKMPLLNL